MQTQKLSKQSAGKRPPDWLRVQGKITIELKESMTMSSTPTAIAHIIKKDRFKMAAGVGLSTSLSKYFVRMEYVDVEHPL